MLRGPQKDYFELSATTPAECAKRLESGEADIGLVPCFELGRREMAVVPGLGIVSRGPVRSILLVSKAPPPRIRTLAADSSSRSSVALARIVLERRDSATPRVVSHEPDLEAMLQAADAALIIGDPALHVDVGALPYEVRDLGQEWQTLTGLPMVFAMWAGRAEAVTPEAIAIFHASHRYGMDRIEEIVAEESKSRALEEALVRRYLTSHIHYEVGEPEQEGLSQYLAWSSRFAQTGRAGPARSGFDSPPGALM